MSRVPALGKFAVIVPALMISLLALVPAAFAAGDTIQVLSNDWEFRFPGDVVFDLAVEGEARIVEVRLFYRASPSGPWVYAYPELTAGHRVETSLNLKLSGMSYIPPGTEVEYYYSILDSEGNVLETKPETFLYFDNRFEWRTTDAGPLTIYWHNLNSERVRQVAKQVERSLSEISELLEVSLDRQVRGIIYNSRSESREAFPRLSETLTEQEVFSGFAFPERGAFIGVGLHPGLIVHESAHLLLREATDSPRAKVPAWVDEGFASYVEQGTHRAGRALPGNVGPEAMPLRQMYTVPGRPGEIRTFYRKAESVVGYLLASHDPRRFRVFLQGLNAGREVDEALANGYGFGLEELERRWASALAQQPSRGPANGGAPFSYLDTVLIAVIVVVVMVVVITNFAVRKLIRRREGPEEWERLTEDEWEGRP